MNSRTRFTACLLLALACAHATAIELHLPPQPTEAERFAAAELRDYLSRMNAGDLSITLRRDAALGRDAFRVEIQDKNITLTAGNDRAALYAAYELLEQLGCRFFAPGDDGEVIPSSLNALPDQDVTHRPWFIQREIGGGACEGLDAESVVDWAVKNRLNRRFGLRFALLRKHYPDQPEKHRAWAVRGGDLNWQWICHNFSFMFPRDSGLFETHPEYFALYKNRRLNLGTPQRSHYGGGNLCTTHPDVIRRAAEFAIQWFDDNPDGTVVPMWPGDGAIKWCECDDCRALGGVNFMPGPEGSMSRRLITFTNAVASLVAEKHPDRLILLPAYANYLAPQPDMTIEPNILVQYCYHGDYAHGPEQSDVNADAAAQMRTWAAQAPGRFGIWEYFLIGDHAVDQPVPVLLPLVYRVRDTVQFLKSIDARYYFTQSNAAYLPYNALLHHALARYLWQPDLDADALIDDFCRHYYGNAGSTLTRYYQLLERAVQTSDWQPQLYSDVATPSPLVFTDDVVSEAEQLLASAESESNLTDVQRRRIAQLRTAHDFTVSNVRTQSAAGLDGDRPWRLARYGDYYVINADGHDVDPHRFDDMVRLAVDTGRFDRNFERLVFRAQKRRADIVFLENDRIQVAVVPEIGGRIVRLIDKASGRNFLAESPGSDQLDTIGDAYFNYGGYEEYIGKAFAGPGWETPYTVARGDHELTLTAEIDDFRLTRKLVIQPGSAAVLKIESTLTNLDGNTRTTTLRAHPMFDLGGASGDNVLHLAAADKTIRRRLAEEHDGLSVQPDGLWAVVDEQLNVGVVNRFDASAADAYVFNDPNGRYFNFELMGRSVDLAPGASMTLAHQYTLLTDAARQLPLVLAGQPVEAEPIEQVKPLNDRVDFTGGVVGQAAAFDDESLVSYPAHYIKANAGTIEGWCRLPVNAAEAKAAHLIGVGDNNPAWFQTTVHEGRFSVLFKDGRKPYQDKGEYYASLAADVGAWKADRWHHFAIVWGNVGEGQSLLQIYINGKLEAERYNVTLGRRYKNDSIAVGRSSASATQRMRGHLDELRISNHPRTGSEIAAAFEAVRRGESLEPGNGTLLLIGADGEMTAASRTSLPMDDQGVALRVGRIIEDVKK